MRAREQLIAMLALLCAATARAEMIASRAALESGQPVAACKLQTLPQSDQVVRQPAGVYMLQPPPENPLDNYERTPLGDWRMPASMERQDPWLRLLLAGPKRPLVVDLAVLIDGRPFRESREAWIDELLAAPSGNKADDSEGTNSAEGTSEDGPAGGAAEPPGDENRPARNADDAAEANADTQAAADEKADAEAAKAAPGVQAQARQAPSMRERLQDYLAANGGNVGREEIRWMIAEWGTGPPVLLLGPSLSWQRAAMAPLVAVLDRDENGELSAAERNAAEEYLRRADTDANDVLDASELRRAADRPAATPFATGHSLIVQLDEETDWDELARTWSAVYGANPALAGQAASLRQLASRPADVTLRVDFRTDGKSAAGVSIVSVNKELGDAKNVVTASPDVVTLDLGTDYIEFSAAQESQGGQVDAASADDAGAQIAVGAAIDGNPLERLLDRDNDQRFTTRERQEIDTLLTSLDRNGDGAVGPGEMPLPIRFAVTLGPHVHRLLAAPVGAARSIAPRDDAPAAPAWFTSMDKNGDHDLSRGEFLGTSDQFRQFDADGDGLLSVAEAVKLDAGQ